MRQTEKLKIAWRTAKLMRSQWWDKERIRRYQQKKLERILSHATRHVPHYQRIAYEACSSPADSLQQFPILTKADLQAAGNALHAENRAADEEFRSRTSGSTGEPTTTLFDRDTWITTKYALKARRVLSNVHSLRQRLLIVGERSDRAEAPAGLGLTSKLFVSVAHLYIDDNARQNSEKLITYRPTVLDGYPSYLEHLGWQVSTSQGTPLNVPVLFTSSETLTQAARRRLEGYFAARVVDIYGSTEFKEIAVECSLGRYHINFESVYVESAPTTAGLSQLLVTSLTNTAMPLIRYDIGDLGVVGDDPCDCGRQSPYLVQPEGRKSELLAFPDGSVLAPFVVTTAISQFEEVKNFSVLHTAPWSVTLSFYANPELSTDRRNELCTQLGARLPDGVNLTLQSLSERLPGGKRIAVRRTFGQEPALAAEERR